MTKKILKGSNGEMLVCDNGRGASGGACDVL
jgi:hypothetical protein